MPALTPGRDGTGEIDISGTGVLSVNGALNTINEGVFVGGDAVSGGGVGQGTLIVRDDGVLNTTNIRIADTAGSTGTFNVADTATSTPLATSFSVRVGTAGGTISGGTVNANGRIILADTASAITNVTMTGGLLQAAPGSQLVIGENGTAQLDQSGGTVQGGWISVGRLGGSDGTYNLTGDAQAIAGNDIHVGRRRHGRHQPKRRSHASFRQLARLG